VHEEYSAGWDPQFSDLGSQFRNVDWLTTHRRVCSSA
jgi:hypothetical protein